MEIIEILLPNRRKWSFTISICASTCNCKGYSKTSFKSQSKLFSIYLTLLVILPAYCVFLLNCHISHSRRLSFMDACSHALYAHIFPWVMTKLATRDLANICWGKIPHWRAFPEYWRLVLTKQTTLIQSNLFTRKQYINILIPLTTT